MIAIQSRKEPRIGSRVHVYSTDGKFDFGYGIYDGQVPRADADDSVGFDVKEVCPAYLDREKFAELATAPEQFLRTKLTTARIMLGIGRVIYGHCCWWRVAADERLTH